MTIRTQCTTTCNAPDSLVGKVLLSGSNEARTLQWYEVFLLKCQLLFQTTLRAVCRHLPKASSVSCAGYSTLTGQVQVTSAATTSQLLRGTANHCSLLQHKLCQPWQSHAALSSFGAVNQNKVPQTHPEKGKVVYVGHLAKHVRFVKGFLTLHKYSRAGTAALFALWNCWYAIDGNCCTW